VKFLIQRDENAVVQDVRLGLDYSANAFSGHLACGSYVQVQASKSTWDWANWAYDARNGALIARDGGPVPYNYVVVGIDRYSGGE